MRTIADRLRLAAYTSTADELSDNRIGVFSDLSDLLAISGCHTYFTSELCRNHWR